MHAGERDVDRLTLLALQESEQFTRLDDKIERGLQACLRSAREQQSLGTGLFYLAMAPLDRGYLKGRTQGDAGIDGPAQ